MTTPVKSPSYSLNELKRRPMSAVAPTHEPRQHWSLASIDWHAIPADRLTANDELFYLIASASFMERATDIYTRNLLDYFADDDEVSSWLERQWLPEELQHGQALRRYVEAAWPDFEWERVYDAFLDEFSDFCALDELEPTPSREMASRCVVEMGTATYYRTLSRLSPEPVLAILAGHIADDEVRHYKHFYRYFIKYRQAEQPGRLAVARSLWNRLRMIDGQDSFIVMRHVYGARYPGKKFDHAVYQQLRRGSRRLIAPHFPHAMSVRMLLKPLGLGARTQHVALPIMEALARRFVP
jgi:hypothetical protein